MSYNLDNIKITDGQLFMKKGDIVLLQETLEDNRPESCFLDDILIDPQYNNDDLVKLKSIAWCDIWSGRSYDTFLQEIVPKMVGNAIVVETWESGDTTEIYRIKNGKKENIKTI